MADHTSPDLSSTPTDLLPEPAPSATPRRRRALVLWGVLAVLAVGAATVVVRSRDGDPPRLPIALGAASGESTKQAAGTAAGPVGPATDMAMLRPVTYVAGADLPLLGGSAAAYRLRGGITQDQVRNLAGAFGLTAQPTRDGTHWTVRGDDGQLDVDDGGGGTWWYSSGAPIAVEGSVSSDPASSDSVSSDAVSSDPGATTLVEPCPPDAKCAAPEPFVPPADLPTEAAARAKALDLLRSVGVDVEQADVHVDGPYEAWYVTVEPKVDGLVASGLSSSVQVGPKGVIVGAGGTLARPERLGDYPVLDTHKAIDRLNAQMVMPMGRPEALTAEAGVAQDSAAGSGPAVAGSVAPAPDDVAPVPKPYTPPEPETIVLHGAERILLLVPASDGSTDAYLVPGCRFTGDQETVMDQIVVDDASLVPPTPVPTVAPDAPQVDPAVGETKPAQ